MVRRRSSRAKRAVKLQPVERMLFVVSATLYLVGLFGWIGLLAMPVDTAVTMLAIGGGIQIALTLRTVF
jgi:cytochrome c oxidase subunit IV